MAETNSKAGVEDALKLFVTSPPDGTPPEVLDALNGAVTAKGAILPPKLFMEAVAQMSVAVSITDTRANILYANKACAALTGYDQGELLGKNESILSDKGTPRSVYEDLWQTIQDGQVWTGMLVNRRKDKTKYLADLTIAPVLNADGKVSYYLGMHRDVTDVHNLQQELLNQKSLIENVVDSAPVAVALVDVRKRVVLDNLAYKTLKTDMAKMEPAEMVLTHWLDNIGMEWKDARKANKEFRNIEIRLDLRRGTRWYACSGTWAHGLKMGARSYFDANETQQGLLIVCSDITEQRRQYELARANAVKAMMTDYQMQSGMREVVHGAIFQMQGPVNVMAAAADLLKRRAGEGSSELAAVSQALEAGQEALARLRNCLPDINAEPVQAVNINEIVRDVLEISTERLLKESIHAEWKPMPVLPMIPGKANALRAMIKHLLDNAIDAISEPDATDRTISVETAMLPGGGVEVRLRDSGPGIAAQDRHQVFEPFYSAWKTHKGRSGMGLTVAQQVITEQGGSIEIDQSCSGGGCVRIVFASPTHRPEDQGGSF